MPARASTSWSCADLCRNSEYYALGPYFTSTGPSLSGVAAVVRWSV